MKYLLGNKNINPDYCYLMGFGTGIMLGYIIGKNIDIVVQFFL